LLKKNSMIINKKILLDHIKPFTYSILTGFCRENGFVVDCFLYKGHDIVYILRCSDFHFFPFLIEPQVRSENQQESLINGNE